METANIAVLAAQTGHLVLSTLHTNSAAETLTRLMSMGVPAFNLASSISLIVAQRLVRRLCPACKYIRNDIHINNTLLHSYTADGCHQCHHGYRGRIAIFEVMPITKPMVNMILSGHNAQDLLNEAISQGMLTLKEAGFEIVRQGLTSLEEIMTLMMD